MRLRRLTAGIFGLGMALSFMLSPINVMAGEGLEGNSIYQIMVDRFYDGDPSNNAKGEAFRNTENYEDDFRYMHGGDWQGVIDKIPYIKGMGYTAIWISPVADPQLWGVPDSNGKQWPTAYHGYNVYDPNRANRYFGSLDPNESKQKLKELVDVCHKNGIKVIIDIVPNHIGDYIQGTYGNAHYTKKNNSLKEGSEVQPAEPFNNINWYHNQGDIDFSKEHPHNRQSTEMLESHDLGGLDDIDFNNEQAKKAVFESIKEWFDYTGADGARVDAAKCMSPAIIHELQEYIGVPTFGENFDMDVDFVSQWVGDDAESGMLDFPLFQAVVNDFAYGKNFDNTDEISLKKIFDQDYMYGDHVNQMVTFIDNHDRNRFLTEAGGNVRKMQNALAFIFTCRGVPTVFQGTEQNRGNANGKCIDGIADTWNRWSMQTKNYEGEVIADYFNTDTDTYKLIASLNELRQENTALREGTQREMWSSPHYYAFSRRVDSGEDEGQEIVCAFNNSDNTIENTMKIRAESSIAAGAILENVFDSSDRVKVTSSKTVKISVDGNSYKIYKLVENGNEENDENVVVNFTIKNAETFWGQNIYLVGNIDELGNWDPDNAVGPAKCDDYPTWNIEVSLPKDKEVEFKAIKKDDSGNVVWESGDNHKFTVTGDTDDYTIYWK
ncbi:Glycosidase [Lachnospiraceae bacterium KH1T2]|nr:Glycosidase [Lachnospiraceae bacterium KH1T2]